MKTVAVLGKGFAGLAATYALSSDYKVTLFDEQELGGGASLVSSGLLHPYPGEKGRRSWHANEALFLAKQLITEAEKALGKEVSHKGGILRYGLITNPLDDVISLGPSQFFISSGWTVFSNLYLEGLWHLCQSRGATFEKQKITPGAIPKGFDYTVFAIGAGIRFFPEFNRLNLGFVKGQIVTCHCPFLLKQSTSAKIYTAMTEVPYHYHIGSTYEREFTDDLPSVQIAKELINPSYPITGCKAGIRVTNRAHYFPVIEQVGEKAWVITALGSRGLLYHAFLAHQLKNLLLKL